MHLAADIQHTGGLFEGVLRLVSGLVQRVTQGGAAHASYPILDDAEFTHALTGLAAKLVAVDGQPSAAEYAAFRSLFAAQGHDEAKLRSQFMRAMHDAAPALQYARAIRTLHPEATALHHEVVDRLLKVASADGALNAAEHELLRAVAGVFGIEGEAWRALVAQHLRPANSNPYAILGATKRMSDEQIRERYMAQVRLLHPDRYQAAGASDDTIAMLSDKLAIINAAYEAIQRQRGDKK